MIEVKRNPELQKIVPFGVPNRFQLLSLLIDSAFITAHVPTIHRTVSKSVLKSGVVCAAPINDDAEKRLLGNLSFLEKIGMATLKVNMERPAAASQLEDGLHQPWPSPAAAGLQLHRPLQSRDWLTVATCVPHSRSSTTCSRRPRSGKRSTRSAPAGCTT